MHDSDMFWQLIEEHRAPLWRFSLGLTRSYDDARDLMSDTVLAAHESFPKLRDLQAFRKSLFTIAIRINKRKEWRRRIFGTAEEAGEVAYSHDRESTHDLELLMEALSKLPEKQREAILLFEISGFSLEEIQTIQGGSLSGVKVRLFRAREILRKELADEPRLTAALTQKEIRHGGSALPFRILRGSEIL